MRSGDQLELVAMLKDKKGKAVRQAEVRALIEDLGIDREPGPGSRPGDRPADLQGGEIQKQERHHGDA